VRCMGRPSPAPDRSLYLSWYRIFARRDSVELMAI
jgi:hypothetical protein